MSTERAIELQELAWSLQAQGELEQAFQAASEALILIEASEGALSLDAANLLNDLVEIERDRERHAAALVLAEKALSVEDALGQEHAGEDAARICLKTATLLGELHRIKGNYLEAEAHLLRGLATAREFGVDSSEAAGAENDLAVLYKYWGRFEQALALYSSALEKVRAIHGDDSLESATLFHNIGGVLHSRGDFAAAEQPARKAWDISRQHLGEDEPRALLDATAYAAVLDGLERYAESEAIVRRALGIFRQRLGVNHYEVAASLHNLAAVLERQGGAAEAEGHYREALRIKTLLLDPESPDLALTRNNLGRLLSEGGRANEAVELLEAALATLQKCLPPDHPQRVSAARNLEAAKQRHP